MSANKYGTVRVEPGSSFSVSCSARGVPKPNLRFVRGDDLISSGGRYSIESNGERSTLTVDMVEDDDRGSYSCIAENSGGATSSTVEIETIRKY